MPLSPSSRPSVSSVAALVLALAAPPAALGQGDAEASEPADRPDAARVGARQTLDPIVVTATRSEKQLFDVPATAHVLSAEDLRESLYRTVPEALRDIPGVMVQKTGHGQGSPFIRGFTGFRTLLLVDGVRLNNSVFRDGPNQYWNTVDPYSIRRLEVIKGPSSVLYGSDAIGGTVNVITKGPTGYGEGFNQSGRVFYRVSTAERSHTGRGELSLTFDRDLGFYAGGTIKHFGDLQSGGGREPMTGYDELDGDFKMEYLLDDNARLVLAHQSVDIDDAWRTHRTIFGRRFEGTTVGDELRRVLDQNRDLTYAQLLLDDGGAFFDRARFSLSYQSQAEERDRVRSDGRRDVQGFDADTFGAWAQFESSSPIGVWTYGAEYYRDEVDSYRRDFAADGSLTNIRVQGPVADDATYETLGLYAQNDVFVTDRLNLIFGGRYTHARADAERVADPDTGAPFSITEDYDALVGSVRFIYAIDEADRWNLFGGVSQGFRAPNLSDLTRFDTARSNEIETPATGLDPERFVSYEVGVRGRYENFSTQASYYYTDISDMIIRQPTGNMIDGNSEVTKRNGGDGFVQGLELEASWRFHPNFTAFGWVGWIDGEVDTFPTAAPTLEREPISRLMPTTGQIGLRWDAPSRDAWLEGVVTIADEQDDLSTRDRSDTQRIPPGGTPGYAVVSLRSGWQVDDNLTVTAALENITDENYRIHGSGVNEPGINLILGVEVAF